MSTPITADPLPPTTLPASRSMLGVIGAAGVLTIALLGSFYWHRAYPKPPSTLALTVRFPAGAPGSTEPLITTGHFSNGDFLAVRYLTAGRGELVYDAWGYGGPASAPFDVEPNREHSLQIEMPSVHALNDPAPGNESPLRVMLDGRTLLDTQVRYHGRGRSEIFVGQNPIGGSPARMFGGKIALVWPHTKSGQIEPGTRFDRFKALVTDFGWQFMIASVASVGLIAIFVRLANRWVLPRRLNFRCSRASAAFLIASAVASVAFALVMTGGTFRLVYPDSFGNFYDFQAVSLLEGHLDVPAEALSNEAFIYGGKYYGYFGPTPAILRIPFVLLGMGAGLVTRTMMVLEYIACLGGIYAVLSQATRLRRGVDATNTAWTTANFAIAAGVGSTLFYLSSRAYIYHEAILCGAAFALWSAYCTLRYLDRPGSRWWLGAIVCGTLSVHARPPIGLFALAFVGTVAATNVLRAVRQRKTHSPAEVPAVKGPVGRHLIVGVYSILGVLSFNALSYLKFHTIDGCPLRYNIQYNAARLARIDGKQFHASNIRYTLDSYLFHPSIRFTSEFPYIATNAPNPNAYPEAKIDMAEPMAGIPYAMPALALLAGLSFVGWWRSPTAARLAVANAWCAVLPAALAMFAAIAVSQRYTADFVPFLVVVAAFGIVAIERLPGALGLVARSGITLLCVWSVIVTLALTIGFQGEGVWGTPEGTHERFLRWRERADHWIHDHVHHG